MRVNCDLNLCLPTVLLQMEKKGKNAFYTELRGWRENCSSQISPSLPFKGNVSIAVWVLSVQLPSLQARFSPVLQLLCERLPGQSSSWPQQGSARGSDNRGTPPGSPTFVLSIHLRDTCTTQWRVKLA